MNTASFLIAAAVYSAFILCAIGLPIKCPSSSAKWCETKEIAAVCGVSTNVLIRSCNSSACFL